MAGWTGTIVIPIMPLPRQKIALAILIVVLSTCACAAPTIGYSPNIVDPAFSPRPTSVRAMIPVSGGKLAAVTGFGFPHSAMADFDVERFNADGTSDRSFQGTQLVFSAYDPVRTLIDPPVVNFAEQADYKLIISGVFYIFNGPLGVVRLNEDGTIDRSFHPTGLNFNSRAALAPLADGRIWASFVDYSNSGGIFWISWTRLLASGEIDPAFGAAPRTPWPVDSGTVVQSTIAVADANGGCWIAADTIANSDVNKPRGALLFHIAANGAMDARLSQPRRLGFTVLSLRPVGTGVMYTGVGQDGGAAFGVVGRLAADGSPDTSWPERRLYGTSLEISGIATLMPDGGALLFHVMPNLTPTTYWLERISAANEVDPHVGGYLVENRADDGTFVSAATGGLWQAWATSARDVYVQGAFRTLNGVASNALWSSRAPNLMGIAHLTLDADFSATRLANVSALGRTAAGPLLLGIGAGGAPKRMLLRAAGPTLSALGVPSATADPRLQVTSGGTTLAANDSWAGAAVESATAQVRAFPFATGSSDAATVATLSPGLATVRVDTRDAGVTLAEAYDLDAPTVASRTPAWRNGSVLGFVGDGSPTLTLGFTIVGSNARRVLIRAAGPALTRFGVNQPLGDPTLTLRSGTTVVAANTGWQSAGTLPTDADAANAGAFPFSTASGDSALTAILGAGAYTAQVTNASGASGAALIEVYVLEN